MLFRSIAGVGLDLIRLDIHAETQTAMTLLGLRILMIVVPMVGLFASVVFFRRRYRLDEAELVRISQALDVRRAL